MIDYFKGKGAIVEAIEEGRIVQVSEDYAIRERLLILRKPQNALPEASAKQKSPDKRDGRLAKTGFLGFDDFRKTLKPGENDVLKELADNFHWALVQKRKARGLTRKQVAEAISETENSLKMIENGVLPSNNFVLVNKLENYYGISLRKGGRPAESKITNKDDAGKSELKFGDELKGKASETGAISGDDLLLESED